MGVCLRRRSVGHRIVYDAHVGGDPLKVDEKSRRGQLEKKVVTGKHGYILKQCRQEMA